MTTLKECERALILQTPEAADWVIGGPTGAAAKLGLKQYYADLQASEAGDLRACTRRRLGSGGTRTARTGLGAAIAVARIETNAQRVFKP